MARGDIILAVLIGLAGAVGVTVMGALLTERFRSIKMLLLLSIFYVMCGGTAIGASSLAVELLTDRKGAGLFVGLLAWGPQLAAFVKLRSEAEDG